MSKLGQIKVIPSGKDFNGVEFTVGIVTIPAVVNLATSLAEKGIIFPKMSKPLSRGLAAGLTLVGHIGASMAMKKPSSFLLGAFLGQVPTALDALGQLAVEEIQKAQGPAKALEGRRRMGAIPIAAAPNVGQTEEQQLMRLREELERASVSGSRGNRRGVMVVN
jgi:hypothetical protein